MDRHPGTRLPLPLLGMRTGFCLHSLLFAGTAFLFSTRGVESRTGEESAGGSQQHRADRQGGQDAVSQDPEGPGQEKGEGGGRCAAGRRALGNVESSSEETSRDTGGAGGKKASGPGFPHWPPPSRLPIPQEGGLSFVFLHPSQEVVKKEEKSGSGQSPLQGNLKKEDAAKTSKGSKCWHPSEAATPSWCGGRSRGQEAGGTRWSSGHHPFLVRFLPGDGVESSTQSLTLTTAARFPGPNPREEGLALRRGPPPAGVPLSSASVAPKPSLRSHLPGPALLSGDSGW